METILTTGRTSRLYNLLVTEMGIAESVSVSNGVPATRYPNLFTIFAKPRYPHTNTELEEVILREIEKIKTQPVTDMELAKAKNQLRMDYIKNLDSNGELASTLSYYEVLLGDYRYISNYLNITDKVSAEDIQKAAKLYLNKENRTIAVLNTIKRRIKRGIYMTDKIMNTSIKFFTFLLLTVFIITGGALPCSSV